MYFGAGGTSVLCTLKQQNLIRCSCWGSSPSVGGGAPQLNVFRFRGPAAVRAARASAQQWRRGEAAALETAGDTDAVPDRAQQKLQVW